VFKLRKTEGSRSENVKFVSRFIPMVIKHLKEATSWNLRTECNCYIEEDQHIRFQVEIEQLILL
jgi:hypothetical protein